MKITKAFGRKLRLLGAQTDKLSRIPGLKVDGWDAIGYIDAISVVLKRHGKPPLEMDREVPDFDGPESLRPYQRAGIGWLVEHLGTDGGALLADDMGLGKTVQSCLTWEALGHPQLCIVSPASVRRGWLREMQTWTGTTPLLVEKGPDWKKWNGMAPVVTSYQLVQKAPDTFMPDMLVMDEMQNLRGRGTKQSRYLLDMAKVARYRLGLTGTPMWSRPADLWMVLRILFPDYRFGSAEDFDFAYCNAHVNQWGGRVNTGSSNADELALRLKYVMLRRLKSEVATDLPHVTRITRTVEPDPVATEKMKQAMLGRRTIHDALVATLEAKLEPTVEAVIEAGTNCLVFTWLREHSYRLATLLEKAGRKPLVINGDLSHKERDAVVARAVADKLDVVATIDSCGVGVDGLQKATSTVIYHALDYVPIKMSQSLARIDRIGQREPVTAIFMVMEESYDQVVMDVVVDKLDQWMRVMGRDDNTAIRDTLVDGDSLAKMERRALKAMYDAWSET